MLTEQVNSTQPFPVTQQEVEQLVTQVVNFVHDPEVMKSVTQVLSSGRGQLQQAIAQMATGMAIKTIGSIEDQTGRDILPDTELGVLSMIVEELYTVATNYGKEVTPEEVENTLQIASSMYNQAIKQQPAMQGQQGQQAPAQVDQQGQMQQQGQPQGQQQQDPSALGGTY